jgi:hypothetical protein
MKEEQEKEKEEEWKKKFFWRNNSCQGTLGVKSTSTWNFSTKIKNEKGAH